MTTASTVERKSGRPCDSAPLERVEEQLDGAAVGARDIAVDGHVEVRADAHRGILPQTMGRATTAVCVAATVAFVLSIAGSAGAATKWLCGPGVANDPCRPSLSTTLYKGWSTRVGTVTPKRDADR